MEPVGPELVTEGLAESIEGLEPNFKAVSPATLEFILNKDEGLFFPARFFSPFGREVTISHIQL